MREGVTVIEELLQLVAPPAAPVEADGATRWAEVEHLLGTRLPADLRVFAAHYGSGYFTRPVEVTVLNPLAPSYPAQLRLACKLLRERRGLPDESATPFGVFPDHPGWLPWGHREGDVYCWLTEGEPDTWPLLLISDHCKSFQQLALPMTTFLARLFSGQLRPYFLARAGFGLRPPGQFIALQRAVAPDSPLPQPGPALEATGAAHRASPWIDRQVSALRKGLEAASQTYPWDGEWLPPDALGRPTRARVVLGPGSYQNIWNGFAAMGFTAYPDWWHNLPRPLHRWQRGQLLGWRLGGTAGADLHNLVPLTGKAQRILWLIETGVAAEVLLGARMSYTVRAQYEGTNRYPARIAFAHEHLPGFPGFGKTAMTIENE